MADDPGCPSGPGRCVHAVLDWAVMTSDARPRRTACAVAALLLLAAGAAARGAEPPERRAAAAVKPGWVHLELARELKLGAIGAADLFGGGPTHARGIDAARLPLPAVSRALPRVAQLRLADGIEPAMVQVSFEVTGDNGRRGVLSGDDDPEAEVGVVFEPLTLQPLGRDGGGLLVDAPAVVHLDFSRAGSAGRYSGRLTVTVSGL